MKRFAFSVVIGLLVLAGPTLASEVTNVELGYRDGSVTARIDITGPVRFTHQTEVPKDGRPHRVIVDILSATHELGAKEFLSLPKCAISGIRTSQFSVKPERTVRIVFDLTTAPVYQVQSDQHSVTLIFDHKGQPSFHTWSTSKVVAGTNADKKVMVASKPNKPSGTKSVAQKNQAIEKDRATSLQGSKTIVKVDPAPKAPAYQPKATKHRLAERTYSDMPLASKTVAVVKPTATKPTPSPAKKSTPTVVAKAKPKAKAAVTVATKPTPSPAKKSTPTVAAKAKPKTKAAVTVATKPTPSPAKKSTPTVASKAKPKAKAAVTVATKPTPPPAKKSTPTVAAKAKPKTKAAVTVATKPTPSTVKKSTPTVVAKAKPKAKAKVEKPTAPINQGQQALAKKLAVAKNPSKQPQAVVALAKAKAKAKAEPTKKSTSRFRRKATSAKIAGTMVAEFPKRLVIKYRARGRRDPFGSLIDDDRRYNSPIEEQVPNVEGLRLVGVIEADGDVDRALFEDNTGYSYMLKSGDKVRNGYVLRVEPNQVHFQIFEYGWSRTVALQMEL